MKMRREEALKKRKEKKRQWLREMYRMGKSGAPPAADGGLSMSEGRADTDDEEPDEEDLDALLEWSDALNYDAYHADWLGLATSHRPDKYSTASALVSIPGLAGAPQ